MSDFEKEAEATAAGRFEARFDGGFFQLSSAGLNTFGLKGRGEIEIGDPITIRAGKKEIQLAPSRIVNAHREGKKVRFDVVADPSEAKPRPLWITLFANEEESAQAILDRLPQQRTEEFARAQADAAEFATRLVQATPRAYVTPAIVAINVVVFLLMLADGAGVLQPNAEVHVRWGSNFGPLTTGGEWWRLFTCMFVHFGVLHLALNMWALYDTGRVVERLYGNAHFLVLYVAAGLCGSMASLFWNPMVNSAGASGAIFGVYGALLAYVLRPGSEIPMTVMKEHRNSTLAFILYSLFYGFSHAGIDNAAHLGGLAGGAAVGWLLARPLDPTRRAASGALRLAAALLIVPLVLGALTLPLTRGSGPQRLELLYQRDLAWFIKQEATLVAAFEKVRREVGATKPAPTDAVIADRVESEVVKPWADAYTHMSEHPLDAASEKRAQQDLLLQYIAGRRDGYRLLAQAVREHDPAKEKAATESFKQANAAIHEFNKLATKKK